MRPDAKAVGVTAARSSSKTLNYPYNALIKRSIRSVSFNELIIGFCLWLQAEPSHRSYITVVEVRVCVCARMSSLFIISETLAPNRLS